MQSVLYAIAHPSVCPSVCLSHEWISQKRLKLKQMFVVDGVTVKNATEG